MKRLENKQIGIDQGEIVLFSDYENGGDMWTGDGDRTRRHSIRFTDSYRTPPSVQCALSMWDIDSATNGRVEVSAEAISETGFDVVFRTWADTHIARAPRTVDVNWRIGVRGRLGTLLKRQRSCAMGFVSIRDSAPVINVFQNSSGVMQGRAGVALLPFCATGSIAKLTTLRYSSRTLIESQYPDKVGRKSALPLQVLPNLTAYFRCEK